MAGGLSLYMYGTLELKKKTEKDWKLSFMVNHHFDLPSWTMWYFPWMKSLQAQFCCVNCWYPVLHLRKHVVTASAVLIRICKVIFALKKSSQIWEGWVKVEEAEWQTKVMILSQWKASNLSLFSKWISGELTRKLENMVKSNSMWTCPVDDFWYYFSGQYCF